MSFGFRDADRPSLRDRLRGKSGDQILEELRKKLDKDKEMFFERVPNQPSFRRAGFPFDDDGLGARGRPDFRHRLEELAQQHPEFADSLRPWYEQQQQQQQPQPQSPQQHAGGDAGRGFRQRTGSNSSQHQAEPQQQEAKVEPEQQQQQQPNPGLAHHGLRNTVDLGEAQAQAQGADSMDGLQDDRGKRAQSAPPAPEQQGGQGHGHGQGHGQGAQRFVSRLDIHPQPAAAASQDPAAAKPPSAPRPQAQAAKGAASGGNVRQIPIFVEGRDEPVMARDDVDSAASFGHGPGHGPSPGHGHGHGFGPSRSPFGSRMNMGFPSWREPQHEEAPAHKRPFPQQQHQPPPQPPTRQQQQPQQQQQPPRQQTPPQHPPQQQAPPPPPQQQQQQPPPPPPPSKPKDALDKVREVQVEVESLAKQVDEFSGSRRDKHYLFLDEMLTRELIKLDVIETEGRDDVRSARKETIRSIQQCISRLEAKADAGGAPGPAVDPAASSQTDIKTEGAEAASPTPSAEAVPAPSSSIDSASAESPMDTTPVAEATAAAPAEAPSAPTPAPATPSPAPDGATAPAEAAGAAVSSS